MTDTFTVCCLRTRIADANDRGDTIYIHAAGAARFVFEDRHWAAHTSSWLCGGHSDPDGTALQWIANQAVMQPLVFWSLPEFVQQAIALVDQVDISGPNDPTDDLKAIRMAVGRSAIPSVQAHYPNTELATTASPDDERNRTLIIEMQGSGDTSLISLHRSVIAEAELIGRLAIKALGREAELD
tara:strand:+ start:129 stop:680 length:552 start_codon:yes stop_codon:yes gene_type:complete